MSSRKTKVLPPSWNIRNPVLSKVKQTLFKHANEQRKHPLQAFCHRTRAGQDPEPRSTTKVLKLFVSSCGVEQKKSEAGAVTETVRKARSTLERPKSKQRRKTVHCYRKIRNKDKALLWHISETKKNTKHRSKIQHALLLSKFSLHKDEALLCTTKKFTPGIEKYSTGIEQTCNKEIESWEI